MNYKEDLIGTEWKCYTCGKTEIITSYGVVHNGDQHMSNIPLQLLYDCKYTKTKEDVEFAKRLLYEKI